MTSKRNKPYRDLESLIELSGSSPRALTRDGYGKWTMAGNRGHVYADRKGFVIYVIADNGRRWSRVKRDLAFCTVPQDYEDEGVFRLDRMPSKAEAPLIRKHIDARCKGPQIGEAPPIKLTHPYLPVWDKSTRPGSTSLELTQASISGPADVIAVDCQLDHPDWRIVTISDGITVETRRTKLAKPHRAMPHCMTCGTAVNPQVTRFCSEACREDFDKGAEPFEPPHDLPMAA